MGSVVEYRCPACAFSSGRLSLGWGKAGRTSYWGGLALCEACKTLSVVDLADTRSDRRDRRCGQCQGLLKLLEGIAHTLGCPQCGKELAHAPLESWV
jgi:predicted RNA-binding Zn-ribbon protein involved in translation (DUF1610 family)